MGQFPESILITLAEFHISLKQDYLKRLLQKGAKFSEVTADRQIHEDSRGFLDENSTVWE